MASVLKAFESKILTSSFKVNRLPPLRFTSPLASSNNNNNIHTQITTFTKTLSTSSSLHKSSIGSSSSDEDEVEINKSLRAYASKQTAIALGMTKKLLLLNEAKDSNLVCAPLSIQTVLSLLNPKTNSTLDDRLLAPRLAARVFADGSRKGGPDLSCVNGLWTDESVHLEPSLVHAVNNAYKMALNRVDFKTEHEEVRTRANSWLEKETNGLIKDALSPCSVDTLTRLLFANASYFKGDWDQQFDASKTKKYDFQLLDGNVVKGVPYMTSWKRQFIRAFDGFKVLNLPYRTGKDTRWYSMCLFLPDAKDGLLALVDRLNSEPGFLDDHNIPNWPERVGDLRIPKFKFSFGFEACNVVKDLGLLRGLTEEVKSLVGEPLFLPSIFHKAVIEVTEKGSKAGAATTGRFIGASPDRPKEIDFVADHPFMFVIREGVTGTVLFIGSVLNPLNEG